MTGYVVTRWYRAPEVILNWMHYTQTGQHLFGKVLIELTHSLNQASMWCWSEWEIGGGHYNLITKIFLVYKLQTIIWSCGFGLVCRILVYFCLFVWFCIFSKTHRKFQHGWKQACCTNLCSALTNLSAKMCYYSSNRRGNGKRGQFNAGIEVFESMQKILTTCMCLLVRNWFCLIPDYLLFANQKAW